jgi:peptide-methionine (S)-S-oxide reductase
MPPAVLRALATNHPWGQGETHNMPTLIAKPTRIEAAGNKPKLIDEYIGRVNSGHSATSIAHMRSPAGWVEQGQTPEFTEFTIVLKGMLRVTHRNGVLDVQAGQAVVTQPGEWVQYSTPEPEGAEYIAVCLPAFSPATVHRDETSRHETATLAGGCFWCLEAVFEQVRGVEKVESGYTGGSNPSPTYEQVCAGATGHAEVVQVTFDPQAISYREVLEIFFGIHDPTTLNRQGADVGTQYRSAIFYHNPEQKQVGEKLIAELNGAAIWDRPIVTQVVPLEKFYPGEAYHQGYFRRHPEQGYCQAVISPKVAKFRKRFQDRLRV